MAEARWVWDWVDMIGRISFGGLTPSDPKWLGILLKNNPIQEDHLEGQRCHPQALGIVENQQWAQPKEWHYLYYTKLFSVGVFQ